MGGQSYCCPDCGKWFAGGLASLGEHMRVKHPQPPVVLNRADFYNGGVVRLPPGSTYCGRGTPFGNDYRIGIDGTRDEVIDRYIAERSQDEAFLALVRRQLRGRHLVCHCAPKRCHCNWLIQVANAPDAVR
jgi:hypothetical protein